MKDRLAVLGMVFTVIVAFVIGVFVFATLPAPGPPPKGSVPDVGVRVNGFTIHAICDTERGNLIYEADGVNRLAIAVVVGGCPKG